MPINRTQLPTNAPSSSQPRHGENAGFESDRSAKLLLDVLYHYRNERKYLLHEFVIMPDHIHLLITLDAEMTVEKSIQLIKGGFSFRAGRELGFRAPVWQKGFSEIRVHDPTAYVGIREYIHANPVKRFLAVSASDYAHSSAHPGFALDPPPQRLKARSEAEAFGIAKAMP
jgi:putative transposase